MRRARFFRRLLLAAGGLGVVLLVAQFIILPRIVRRQIATTLESAGLPDVSFDVRHATLWGTELSDLVIGNENPTRVATVALQYSPSTLWRGRLDSIRLSGIEIIVDAQSGIINLGPWADLHAPASNEPSHTSTDLPLDRLELVSSSLLLGTGQTQVRLPFDASLIRSETNRYRIAITVDTRPQPLRVEGVLQPNDEALELDVSATALPAALLVKIAAMMSPDLHPGARGQIALSAHLSVANGRAKLSGTLKPDSVSIATPPDDKGRGTNLHLPEGVLTVDAEFGAVANPTLRLGIEDFMLSTENPVFSADGISGAVVIDGFEPFSTAPATLVFGSAKFGDAEFTGGTVPFEVNSPNSISIGQTTWDWLGGKVTTMPITFDPAAPAMDLKVAADRLELKHLLELVAKDKVIGDGRIDARLMVRIDGSGVAIGDGVVRGTGGGTLKVLDTEVVAATLTEVDRRRPKRANEPNVAERVVEAMKDFEYDMLKADLKNEPEDGLVLYMRIIGRGRSGTKQAVDYEPTVRGAGELLAPIFGIHRMSETQPSGKAAKP